MKNLEKIFIENQTAIFTELKSEYLIRKAKARNIHHVIKKHFEEIREKSSQFFTNASFNVQDKNFKIIELMDEDINLKLNEAIKLASESKPEVEKENVATTVSTLRAYQQFNQFLRDEEDKLRTPD